METTTQKNHPLYQDLYHRAPYLLIDEVLDVSPEFIEVRKVLEPDSFYFKGHFPGAPILPGALMQEMTTQAAGVLIARCHNPIENYDTENLDPNRLALGVLSRIKDAKFKGFAKPGDELLISVTLANRVDQAMEFVGTIKKKNSNQEEVIMKNRFLLTSVPSSALLA